MFYLDNKCNTCFGIEIVNTMKRYGAHICDLSFFSKGVGQIVFVFSLFAIFQFDAMELLAQESNKKISSTKVEAKEYRSVTQDVMNPFANTSFWDGPHVFWKDSSRVNVWYIHQNGTENTLEIKAKQVKVKKDSVRIKGTETQGDRHWIYKKNIIPPMEFSGVKKILSIGDVHGEYKELISMLKTHKVVDEQLNWSWGDGHIVFIGDILDRGSQVTECLWLIRKLAQQAKVAGGRVHLLLGNHEIMVLMGDGRYASTKYQEMCKRLAVNYGTFFAPDTELGRWLRSLNSVIRINDVIFVHAGLSPKMMEEGRDLSKMNRDVRYGLLQGEKLSIAQRKQLLYDPQNPIWYRGYVMKSPSYDKIQKEQIDKLLAYYKVSHIVCGHTEVNTIRSLFGNRILMIDVPFGSKTVEAQVLLVENNQFYRLFINGKKELIE